MTIFILLRYFRKHSVDIIYVIFIYAYYPAVKVVSLVRTCSAFLHFPNTQILSRVAFRTFTSSFCPHPFHSRRYLRSVESSLATSRTVVPSSVVRGASRRPKSLKSKTQKKIHKCQNFEIPESINSKVQIKLRYLY